MASAVLTLANALHDYRKHHPGDVSDPAHEALAGVIDTHVKLHEIAMRKKAELNTFVFVGPRVREEQEYQVSAPDAEVGTDVLDETDGYNAYFIIKARSPYIAKYIAIVRCCEEYNTRVHGGARMGCEYSVVRFLQELIDSGATLGTSIHVFKQYAFDPFYVLPPNVNSV